MSIKWAYSDLYEARKVVEEFRRLSQLFVDTKGYLYLDKQSREVCDAVQAWLDSCTPKE